ncbi:hypothetical protein B566_EDAN018907 [Ephemera danica]|nr:hypothetical protein B566_EDAN018907 [Ephemera danica]
MQSSCRLQSGLGRVFWDWLHLAVSLPFVRAIVVPLRPYSPGGILNALATAPRVKPPAPSIHRLRRGLPGYLILFDPHAFAPQRQYCARWPPSPLMFLQISTDFTPTPGIPPPSHKLKALQYQRQFHGWAVGFHLVTYKAAYERFTPKVYDPKAFIPHAASLRQAFAHCAIFPTAASRRSLGRVPVPVWPVTLSGRLLIIGLVSHYPTNYLMRRGLIYQRQLASRGRLSPLCEKGSRTPSGGDMLSKDTILNTVLARVSDEVADSIRHTVVQAVERELSSAITKALAENEFYRQLNDDMRSGLRGIYHEIVSVAADEHTRPVGIGSDQAKALFTDATKQIEEVMQTTLEAAEQIMEGTERLFQQQEEASVIIASLQTSGKDEQALNRLDYLNNDLASILTQIMTSLSFQDLTGQRLKKVLSAIASIQEAVFDLYVSTGLILRSKEETPEKNLQEITAESKRKVEELKRSELKGPTRDASQANVDDLLASLGL